MTILDNFENPQIDEKNVGFSKVVLKWGLISGGVSIAMQLIMQILHIQPSMNAGGVILGLVSMGISIAILVMALREHRDGELGGFISFGRAFLVALLVMVLSTLMTATFQYVYFNFINPSALDAQMDAVRKITEKWINDEEQLDKVMEQSRASMTSPMSIVTSTATVAIAGSIVALILAAIFNRKRPMFNS